MFAPKFFNIQNHTKKSDLADRTNTRGMSEDQSVQIEIAIFEDCNLPDYDLADYDLAECNLKKNVLSKVPLNK